MFCNLIDYYINYYSNYQIYFYCYTNEMLEYVLNKLSYKSGINFDLLRNYFKQKVNTINFQNLIHLIPTNSIIIFYLYDIKKDLSNELKSKIYELIQYLQKNTNHKILAITEKNIYQYGYVTN